MQVKATALQARITSDLYYPVPDKLRCSHSRVHLSANTPPAPPSPGLVWAHCLPTPQHPRSMLADHSASCLLVAAHPRGAGR